MPHQAIRRPAGEARLGHELGLHPMYIAHIRATRRTRECRGLPFESLQTRMHGAELLAVEAGAHLSCIVQTAVVSVHADQQGADAFAACRRICVPSDHELLALAALELDPGTAAAGGVGRMPALADQALDPVHASLFEYGRTIPIYMLAE